MRLLPTTAFLIFAVSALDRAQADPYPWCAVYGDNMGGSTNCYMRTLAECRAAISGNGGFCNRNTFYDGPAIDGDRPASSGRSRKKRQS